jgi:hypothetical protein
MELADLLVGTAVTVIGLYLTHSLRRQQRLRVAEQRMASYRELWKLMEIARPTRLEAWEAAGPLTREEARGLYADMTHWYFGTGHGMLLTETTKKLYLQTKESIGRYAVGTSPDWERAGRRAIRELSLLRQQMKLDLDIYGVSYFGDLDADDKAFLRNAGINPRRWAQPSWSRRLATAIARIPTERAIRPAPARSGTMSTGTGVDSTPTPGSSPPA